MENSVLIYFDNEPFITVLTHEFEFLTVNQILDKYSEFSDIDRSRLTGRWIRVIDITTIENHQAKMPYAKNVWS
jgi:hypothetical protein